MKVYIISMAFFLLFSMFTVYTMDNDEYLLAQQRYKSVANDAADAACLFYDKESFSNGIKIYNKDSGNAAVKEILSSGLGLDNNLRGTRSNYIKSKHSYYTYYFDEDGTFTEYKETTLIKQEKIIFPYQLTEPLTGYKTTITKPIVIVTIDAGKFNFRERFITDTELIRTSGYENVPY